MSVCFIPPGGNTGGFKHREKNSATDTHTTHSVYNQKHAICKVGVIYSEGEKREGEREGGLFSEEKKKKKKNPEKKVRKKRNSPPELCACF